MKIGPLSINAKNSVNWNLFSFKFHLIKHLCTYLQRI
jgi:hypothetical protein